MRTSAPIAAAAMAMDGATDTSATKAWLRALAMTAPITRQPARTLPIVVDALAEKFGDTPALISDRETLSFGALAERANRYARWALAQGLGKGDVVCLLMPNRPEYMAIWLGITRVGAVVSLLNANLTGAALAHCIDIVSPKHVIVADELIEAYATTRPHLATNAEVWSHGGRQFADLELAVAELSGARLTDVEPPAVASRALYVNTSGTTGLPKAAIVSHRRLLTWSLWFAGMMDTRPGDRMYNCLPMYHSVGGVVATGALLVNGGSVVIRDGFSAGRFWDDIARFDCTLFQYIGELCRYLVNTHPHPLEQAHRIRLACGNGLRGDVWNAFKDRFRIPKILEFYAATEGNVTLFNYEGKPGAVGRIPSFLAHRSPTALVRCEPETGEPVRDDAGRCVRCSPGEVGEAIGRILDGPSSVGARFDGYSDPRESEKKLLRDVFEAGDAWFRTGDLMRKDGAGYFYFVDRIGDTFRWKGENVSTTEVSEALTEFPGVTAAAVYGVTIPGAEGRAGMAALAVDETFDLAAFREHLVARMPAYARPLFLRITHKIAATATFKHKKSELVRQGYDPTVIEDAVYFNDPSRQAFLRLDRALYERIEAKAIRL